MKYLLVTGGVISGIGKGIISSSVGAIMKANGWVVTCIKIDPYLNIDAGTFSPYEHGEVYVLDDGSEVDLDLGNYERYINVTLTRDHNITTGKIYQQVTQRERRGEYLGKTVQVVPHVTDAIQEWVIKVAETPVDASGRAPDLCVIELGGTIGDIESMPFVEAFRQLLYRVGSKNFCCAHVSLVPNLSSVGEPKTKPTQVSIRELRARGLQADILFCRCNCELSQKVIEKLALFCQVPADHVIQARDVVNLYQVPLALEAQKLSILLSRHFDLELRELGPEPPLAAWQAMVDHMLHATETIRVAVAGKYTKLSDAYLSLLKACEHAATHANCKLKVDLVDSEDLEPAMELSAPEQYHEAWLSISNAQAVIVAGGFGPRGCEGKIAVIRYCRERGIPFLGICLGFQLAVVEFARNDSNSTEFNPNTPYPVVIDMPEFNPGEMGGTMRLGSRRTNFVVSSVVKDYLGTLCDLKADRVAQVPGSISENGDIVDNCDVAVESDKENFSHLLSHFNSFRLVNAGHIYARHRHRYEVNPSFVKDFESSGFAFVGRDAGKGNRMEIGELIRPITTQNVSCKKTGETVTSERQHPYFVGTQFHPEYTSRPMAPSPFFVGLILTARAQCSQSGQILSDLQSTSTLGPRPLLQLLKSWHPKQPASMSYNSLFPPVKECTLLSVFFSTAGIFNMDVYSPSHPTDQDADCEVLSNSFESAGVDVEIGMESSKCFGCTVSGTGSTTLFKESCFMKSPDLSPTLSTSSNMPSDAITVDQDASAIEKIDLLKINTSKIDDTGNEMDDKEINAKPVLLKDVNKPFDGAQNATGNPRDSSDQRESRLHNKDQKNEKYRSHKDKSPALHKGPTRYSVSKSSRHRSRSPRRRHSSKSSRRRSSSHSRYHSSRNRRHSRSRSRDRHHRRSRSALRSRHDRRKRESHQDRKTRSRSRSRQSKIHENESHGFRKDQSTCGPTMAPLSLTASTAHTAPLLPEKTMRNESIDDQYDMDETSTPDISEDHLPAAREMSENAAFVFQSHPPPPPLTSQDTFHRQSRLGGYDGTYQSHRLNSSAVRELPPNLMSQRPTFNPAYVNRFPGAPPAQFMAVNGMLNPLLPFGGILGQPPPPPPPPSLPPNLSYTAPPPQLIQHINVNSSLPFQQQPHTEVPPRPALSSPPPPPPPPSQSNLLETLMSKVGLPTDGIAALSSAPLGGGSGAVSMTAIPLPEQVEDKSPMKKINRLLNSAANTLLNQLNVPVSTNGSPPPPPPPLPMPCRPAGKSDSMPPLPSIAGIVGSGEFSNGNGDVPTGERKHRHHLEYNIQEMLARRRRSEFSSTREWQERIALEVKSFIKPFYAAGKVSKEDCRTVLKKSVNKISRSSCTSINTKKIGEFVKLYLRKYYKYRKWQARQQKLHSESAAKEPPIHVMISFTKFECINPLLVYYKLSVNTCGGIFALVSPIPSIISTEMTRFPADGGFYLARVVSVIKSIIFMSEGFLYSLNSGSHQKYVILTLKWS
ncbi:CTP synthase [Echinococcus granulosus]|uniref:CTP synthase n=1 Tax=Echinococcus granulosus TaxID=6210 RepID=W6V9U9_ECHGR|nr:CTP synthase [Echinococcus granulosus]EUB63444.1 CTP synthase [Echinococcus granulosus]